MITVVKCQLKELKKKRLVWLIKGTAKGDMTILEEIHLCLLIIGKEWEIVII